ncbi:MAG: ATPase domain-containing protein, partial [Ramlibacter sp.]
MTLDHSFLPTQTKKSATGITGFDEITGGGLPAERTTLLLGGPGSGKTIFALQFLVNGATVDNEPGIFVAFEESPERLAANFEAFGWDLAHLQPERLYMVDAQPDPELIQSGNFDLGGLLAALGAQAKVMGARRIVFDALDILMTMLPDAAVRRREIYRLHSWLIEHELTGLITAKQGGDSEITVGSNPFRFGEDGSAGFMQFMVDCAIVLNHRVVLGVSQRNLRVQ